MAFVRLGTTMLCEWGPGDDFDQETDRLLVTTSLGETFVARSRPEEADGRPFVMDKAFLPKNLTAIPEGLGVYRTLPLPWDAVNFAWEIFLYDGKMTPEGPCLVFDAVGLGWTRTITTELTIDHIEPVKLEDIKRKGLALELHGIEFEQYTYDVVTLFEAAFPTDLSDEPT